MIEQPNDPGQARQEGVTPPYAVVPLPTAPTPPPAPPPPAQPPAEVDGMYKDGLGFALWCLIVVGLGGVHRIYLGKYATGILFLMTFGLFGIGQFIDLFRMKSLIRQANIREGYLPHPRLAKRMQPAPQQQEAAKLPASQNVQQVLLKAAQANGGALTVTQGVVASGLTFEQVEEILREMVAKGYVDVDNAPNSGVVVYRFPELAGPFS